MNKSDIEKLQKLKDSVYISLGEIIRSYVLGSDISDVAFKKQLYLFELHQLRPVHIISEDNNLKLESIIDDCSDEQITRGILHSLGQASETLNEGDFYNHVNVSFEWTIIDIVDFLKLRDLTVPLEWREWIKTSLPKLQQRGFMLNKTVDEQQGTLSNPETRKAITALRNDKLSKKCEELKLKNPKKSKSWISQKISMEMESYDFCNGKTLLPASIRKIWK